MLASADIMAFVATTDLERARAFYEGVLGLQSSRRVGGRVPAPCLNSAARALLVDPVHSLPVTLAARGVSWE